MELTQPVAVRLHGCGNTYGSLGPPATARMTSVSSGAVSAQFHPADSEYVGRKSKAPSERHAGG
jgi:hypothetical protein